MDLRVLRYFLAVAREENITKAAALLHVTQPTLSRQLMQLEEDLGVKLFRRSQYRVVGTNGSLTGYAGGIDKKVKLLELEHADMRGFFVPKKGTAR